MQEQINEALLDKIAKLLTKAESAKAIGSLQEAEAFTLKVTELLLEHNLSMETVRTRAEKGEKMTQQNGISWHERMGSDWRLRLLRHLARFNFCRTMCYTGSKTAVIFGHLDNINAVVLLFNYLTVRLFQIGHDLYKAEKVHTIGYATHQRRFLKGAALGVYYNLERQQEERLKAEYEAANSANPDKYALSISLGAFLISNGKDLQEYESKTWKDVKYTKTRKDVIDETFMKGYYTGESIELKIGLNENKIKVNLN